MTRPVSFGFFALGRCLTSRKPAPTHYRIIPAANASENNAIEAQVLGWLTIATWALVIDAAVSFMPWLARVPFSILSAFILIQIFTVGVALVLEKAVVAPGKCSSAAARSWHTNGHVALLVLVSLAITTTSAGTVALRVVAWIWLALAVANAIAAWIERRS